MIRLNSGHVDESCSNPAPDIDRKSVKLEEHWGFETDILLGPDPIGTIAEIFLSSSR